VASREIRRPKTAVSIVCVCVCACVCVCVFVVLKLPAGVLRARCGRRADRVAGPIHLIVFCF
jgi:hypothetical protein